jgi:hypothetical protein
MQQISEKSDAPREGVGGLGLARPGRSLTSAVSWDAVLEPMKHDGTPGAPDR